MKIKHIKKFSISFISYSIAIIFVLKYAGFINRFTTAYFEPYTWSQIINILPTIIISSSMAGLFSTFLIEEGKKQKQKNIEDARKRILERQKENEQN